jgi:calcium-dependent protein kinase
MSRLQQEINIMKMMDHPNIISLYETYQDKLYIYLVMELTQGGELFDRIIDAGHFSEADAAHVMQQMLRAIHYMHQVRPLGVCHRDLKPENFLFATKEPINANLLKLIDFGLSKFIPPGQNMTTKAGTPYYVAPEVLAGKYTQQCDSWSAGVIMYTILSGTPPFTGRTDDDLLAKVRRGVYSFPEREWRHISKDAKRLIVHLLEMKPEKRCTPQKALSHDWIKHKAPSASQMNLKQGFLDKLSQFRSQGRFKKAALQVIAGLLDDGNIQRLRETFTALDENGDGKLTIDELRKGLKDAGLDSMTGQLQEIMNGIDADNSGEIDYTEFLAATIDRRSYLQEDVCWTAFNVFDIDSDGKITQEELRQVLQSDGVASVLGAQEAAGLMLQADANGDGVITFDEFMEMMRGSSASASMFADLNTVLSGKAVVPVATCGEEVAPVMTMGKQRRARESPATDEGSTRKKIHDKIGHVGDKIKDRVRNGRKKTTRAVSLLDDSGTSASTEQQQESASTSDTKDDAPKALQEEAAPAGSKSESGSDSGSVSEEEAGAPDEELEELSDSESKALDAKVESLSAPNGADDSFERLPDNLAAASLLAVPIRARFAVSS